ncbi:MAG: hypothetical protein WCO31_01315 [Actinomycetes bacterium]
MAVSKAVKDLLKVAHVEQANHKYRDPAWAGPSAYAPLTKGPSEALYQRARKQLADEDG